jgi:hypothetical protein
VVVDVVTSGLLLQGLNHQQRPAIQRDRCRWLHDDVRQAPRAADPQRLPVERVAQPDGPHAHGVTADRQQRHQAAGRRLDCHRGPAAQGADQRAATDEAQIADPRQPGVEQQHQVGELVVESRTGQRAEDQHLVGAGGHHAIQRQLRVRRILGRRVHVNRDAVRRQPGERRRIGRIEVADHEVGTAADRGQPGRTPIDRHHPIGPVQPARVGPIGLAAGHQDCSHRRCLPPHRFRRPPKARQTAHRWVRRRQRSTSTPFAGMTQIRFEGLRLAALSAHPGAPLSFFGCQRGA